uniref:Gamma-glutamylcyclotransferase family protein n=1 Tax=Desertifilum tharense IPPAS B-1220 TaxID=1781255 RepID=A0ACD5GUF5_9CYAN
MGTQRMIQPIRVFVYGTLKPGEYNYQRYCQGKTIAEQSAIALGELFTLPVGYPALIPGEQPVRGFVLTFNDPQILADLDRLEGYSSQNPPIKTSTIGNRSKSGMKPIVLSVLRGTI